MTVIIDPEGLREQGYGWKRIKVKCVCGWKGKRVWRMTMFDKRCPKCNETNGLGIDKPISVLSPQEERLWKERLLLLARVH